MVKQKSFPYPTPVEVVRYMLRSLDLKFNESALDELARKRTFDPRKLEQVITKKVAVVIRDTMGEQASTLLTSWLRDLLNDYMQFVASVPAYGLSRDEMLKILVKGIFGQGVNQVLEAIYTQFSGPKPSVLLEAKQAVPAVLNWLEENERGWKRYIHNAYKENKPHADRIYAWKRGQDRPSTNSIERLQKKSCGPWTEQIDWQRVQTLLFIARALDALKTDTSTLLQQKSSSGALGDFDMHLAVNFLQSSFFKNIPHAFEPLNRLGLGLRRTVPKSNPQAFQQDFSTVRRTLAEAGKLTHMSYWLDWQEARWQVFSGHLEKANELYTQAVTDALFRAGDEQQNLINEAMVIAASQDNPDRVFLKKLKWSLINFGYDIPSVTTAKPSNKTTDTVEGWEVNLWRSYLIKMFPKDGLFPGVKLDFIKSAKIGPLMIDHSLKIEPNYGRPNTKINVGETWQKRMPQLVWFAMLGQDEICEKLIDKGAKVNVASDAGDTPLLIALLEMDVTDIAPIQSLDDRLFQLFSKQPGCDEVINQRTQKRRLLPIIVAVQSGRVDVVKKVLELGADSNDRGDTDEQTALNICLKLIGTLKDNERSKKAQKDMPITPEVLDSVRRYGEGLTGITLEDQRQAINQRRESPLYNDCFEVVLELRNERILKYLDLNSMREIANLLIDAGADVNSEHVSPLKGYTPLMLAAEWDERKLFERMLIKGGDPQKTYTDPNNGRQISCLDIAKWFKSREVEALLMDIEPYLN